MRIADRLRSTHRRLQEKDDLLMMVTHDLKNPLGRATFASGVLAEMPTLKRDAYTHQLIQQVVYANEEISRLVKMLLSLSEMESEACLDLSVVELKALIERIVQNYQFLARLKGVSVAPEFPDTMLLVEADPVWLEHAIGNLLSNAIKFTPDGGLVSVRLMESDIGVVVQVRDTGIGIRKTDLPHIFEKFYRSRRKEIREAEGSGLGLAIVKTAVSRHGGQVLVDSREGEGSTFSIVLPPRLRCETPAFSAEAVS
jgi:signal transduction histidine kinase